MYTWHAHGCSGNLRGVAQRVPFHHVGRRDPPCREPNPSVRVIRPQGGSQLVATVFSAAPLSPSAALNCGPRMSMHKALRAP